jgi:hypothetical protein
MERLTNKCEADAQREEYERRLANGYPRNIPEERFLRLAAYEDTGLSPQACAEAREAGKVLSSCDISFGRITELLTADKDGRVMVLPVRPVLTQSIGSMLYIIEEGEIVEDSLCEALIGMASNGEIDIFYTTLSDQISFEQADIGKTVFLTREEAEKALEAMKDE